MNLKQAILSIVVFSSISLHALAEVITFQQGVDGYNGFHQVMMYGLGSQTVNHSNNQNLWAWDTPTEGEKKMFIIRFDDIFDPLKGGLSEDMIVTKATIELYSIAQTASSHSAWNTALVQNQQVRMYEMINAVNNGSEGNGHATFTYKNYVNASNFTYWENTDGTTSTQGPRANVDWYGLPRVGTIQMEKGAGNKWYSLDITDVVNNNRALDGTTGNGFFFRAGALGLGMDFASGKYSDTQYRPRLVLEYYVVPEPQSLILMGLAAFTLLALNRRKTKAA
jgi:hypothetical protein